MAVPSFTSKVISCGDGERLIRVLAANPKDSDFHASTFFESEIQSIDDLGHGCSALVLRSGTLIPVALSYEEIEKKIYSQNTPADGSVLDLREVTGEAAKPKTPANTNQALAPGDRMPDGTVLTCSAQLSDFAKAEGIKVRKAACLSRSMEAGGGSSSWGRRCA